jgi:hypothetical protein
VVVAVADGSNRPVKAAQVSALSLDPDHPLRATAFTDEAGSASFDDAAGLPLRVVVDSPGFARWARQLDPAPARVEVVMDESITVEGHVTAVRGRQDVDGASVELVAGGQRRVALTDTLGKYRFADVSPGPVHLSVTHPDYAPGQADATVASTGRADRAFDLPDVDLMEAGIIEGRVVDASGNPVGSARVGIGVLPVFLPVGTMLPSGVTTKSDGTFRLERVRPGHVDVEAYAPGFGRARRTVDVEAGRTADGVTFTLDPAQDPSDPTATGGVAVTVAARDGALVVSQVAPGSEAERGGLQPGDALVAIDRESPTGVVNAVEKLSGPDGSDVVVEVRRGAEKVVLRVRRERVRR